MRSENDEHYIRSNCDKNDDLPRQEEDWIGLNIEWSSGAAELKPGTRRRTKAKTRFSKAVQNYGRDSYLAC